MRAGKPVSRAAAELGISQTYLFDWLRQNLVTVAVFYFIMREGAQLRRTRKRIREEEPDAKVFTMAPEFRRKTIHTPKESPDD